MNHYFLKLTKEERENILDKHRSLYDGYSVKQNTNNLTPLYTQDFANDKEGITVNSKGDVGKYNNKLYIKESKEVCEQCGGGKITEGECNECGYKMNEDKICEQCGSMKTEGECMECGGMYKEMEEGIDDVQDLTGQSVDYSESELGESIWSGIKDRLGFKSKVKKRPYTAEAVQSIISSIKQAKTEEQLESAMNMYFNLIQTNPDEINQAYVERIMTSYKRKADKLQNYLSKDKLNSIMNDVEKDVDFEQDLGNIKESIQESLNWFNRIKKYN
jgi:hypothetical protein